MTNAIPTNTQTKPTRYYWTAKNNSSFLTGYRTAKTLIGAVRAARAYVEGELYGEGTLYIYTVLPSDGGYPIREDSKSIFTKFAWHTNAR